MRDQSRQVALATLENMIPPCFGAGGSAVYPCSPGRSSVQQGRPLGEFGGGGVGEFVDECFTHTVGSERHEVLGPEEFHLVEAE